MNECGLCFGSCVYADEPERCTSWEPEVEACPVCWKPIGGEHGTPAMAHSCGFTDGGAHCVFGPLHSVGYHHLSDGRNVEAGKREPL